MKTFKVIYSDNTTTTVVAKNSNKAKSAAKRPDKTIKTVIAL